MTSFSTLSLPLPSHLCVIVVVSCCCFLEGQESSGVGSENIGLGGKIESVGEPETLYFSLSLFFSSFFLALIELMTLFEMLSSDVVRPV